MLEEEGIIFEEGGKGNKIRKDFFVEFPSVSKPGAKRKSAASSKGSKRLTVEEPKSNQVAITKKKSKYFDTDAVSEGKIKQEILNLLHKRQVGKTC